MKKPDWRPSAYHDYALNDKVARNSLDLHRAKDHIRTALEQLQVENLEAQLSPMEVDLLAAMWRVGLEPTVQALVGPYRVDFLFPVEHVVVEVDGREWHGVDRAKADRRRQKYLRDEHDLVVKRFTGREVFQNPIMCARHVAFTVEWIHERLDRVASGTVAA